MDFKLSPEQELIQDSARAMVVRDIQPILDANNPDQPLPKADLLRIYEVLAGQNLTAPRLAEEHGGGGLKMLEYGLVYEAMPPAIAMSLLAHECTIARIFAESTGQ